MNKKQKTFQKRKLVGSIIWLLITQYFIILAVTRQAWSLPYSSITNAISDLGAAKCGVFAGRAICSPIHIVADISWTITGVSIVLGAALLWKHIATTKVSKTGLAFLVAAGVGEFFVGLNPEDVSAIHIPAAMVTIIGGLIGVTLIGIGHIRNNQSKALGFSGLGCGIIGLTGLVLLLTIGQPNDIFGLLERIAAYPILLWCIFAGAYTARSYRQDKKTS